MVKLEKISDFGLMRNVNSLIRSYLFHYLYSFLDDYDCENITEFGAFYLLENDKDCLKYKEMGLSLPLDKAIPEFTDILTIKNSIEKIKLLHSCFVINNDYAISVFIKPKYLNKEVRNNLLDEYTEREVIIDVPR